MIKIVVDMNQAFRWAVMLRGRGALVTIDANKTRIHVLPFS
jgi:hypothetical protein